jgi:hypothetical protein
MRKRRARRFPLPHALYAAQPLLGLEAAIRTIIDRGRREDIISSGEIRGDS